MIALAKLIAPGAGQRKLAPDEQRSAGAALHRATKLSFYETSITLADRKLFAFARRDRERFLIIVARRLQETPFGTLAPEHRTVDVDDREIDVAILTAGHEAARLLRRELPWTAPRLGGLRRSAGLGDRLGLATPGHVRAVEGTGCMPYFAQQSVREMTRTQRTPQQVMDAATWGVFQAGWREGFGSDADHLKTPADIDACVAAGFTMFTIDPGDHVRDDADTMNALSLPGAVDELPWRELEISISAFRDLYVGEKFRLDDGQIVTFDERSLARAIIKYGGAIAHTAAMFRHLQAQMGTRPFELEVSVDETASPTSVAEHYLIAAELTRLGVKWLSLAPRFVGEFEKGIDYKGDLAAFERSFAQHVAVARTLGPYKLSIHSGSDKFAIYPIAARLAGELIHIKTAGTSYLEALRVVARRKPDLFRRILDFAFTRFDADRASYRISARTGAIPRSKDLPGDRLETVLDMKDGRQLLHVTYGSVLTATTDEGHPRFRDEILRVLTDHEEEHYGVLACHLGRHIKPFAR